MKNLAKKASQNEEKKGGSSLITKTVFVIL